MDLLELNHGALPLEVAVDLLNVSVLGEVLVEDADLVVVLWQVVHDDRIALELPVAHHLLLRCLLVERNGSGRLGAVLLLQSYRYLLLLLSLQLLADSVSELLLLRGLVG